MTAPARLFGIQKADGSIHQDSLTTTHPFREYVEGVLRPGESCVDVEIVRKGTASALDWQAQITKAFMAQQEENATERAAVVARLEAIDEFAHTHCDDSGELISALLSDLKAGRVEGKR